MSPPELVQFADLSPGHFARHPIWVQVHTTDYDEEWYDDTDEETFRPRVGPLPASAQEGMLLTRARFTLADGAQLDGFLTPTPTPGKVDLGHIQPHLFLPDGSWVGFWGGIRQPSQEEKTRLYSALGRAPDRVFPIRFAANNGLLAVPCEGQLDGFYSLGLLGRPRVSR